MQESGSLVPGTDWKRTERTVDRVRSLGWSEASERRVAGRPDGSWRPKAQAKTGCQEKVSSHGEGQAVDWFRARGEPGRAGGHAHAADQGTAGGADRCPSSAPEGHAGRHRAVGDGRQADQHRVQPLRQYKQPVLWAPGGAACRKQVAVLQQAAAQNWPGSESSRHRVGG